VPGLNSGVLNLGSDQEMKGKEADPSHLEHRAQHGVADLDLLELVALERISKSSWMPHFRSTTTPQQPRCLSPTTSSHTREHVEPPERRPEAKPRRDLEGVKNASAGLWAGPGPPRRVNHGIACAVSQTGPGRGNPGSSQSPKIPLGFWGRLIIRIRRAVTKTQRGE